MFKKEERQKEGKPIRTQWIVNGWVGFGCAEGKQREEKGKEEQSSIEVEQNCVHSPDDLKQNKAKVESTENGASTITKKKRQWQQQQQQ